MVLHVAHTCKVALIISSLITGTATSSFVEKSYRFIHIPMSPDTPWIASSKIACGFTILFFRMCSEKRAHYTCNWLSCISVRGALNPKWLVSSEEKEKGSLGKLKQSLEWLFYWTFPWVHKKMPSHTLFVQPWQLEQSNAVISSYMPLARQL